MYTKIREFVSNIYHRTRNRAICYCKNIPYSKNLRIGKDLSRLGGGKITIGEGVRILERCEIDAHGGTLTIGDGSLIGVNCRLCACCGSIVLGKKVLLAPNVFINDVQHKFEDVSVPIIDQGLLLIEREDDLPNIYIGDESWLGVNVVVVGNVHIGKHCVIGSNSVVKGNIPDYSVAVGIPARVIKRYDEKCKKWIRV